MTDPATTITVAVLPFVVLGFASLSKSFRYVLKSIFTSGDSVSVTSKTVDRAPAKWGKTTAVFREYAKTSEEMAKITFEGNTVVITMLGDAAKAAMGPQEATHAGKHAQRAAMTESAE
ncbi:hypothetical protein ABIE18_001869 [Arthrobacter sp. 2762]